MTARVRMRAVTRLVGDDRSSIIKETHLELTVCTDKIFKKLPMAKG